MESESRFVLGDDGLPVSCRCSACAEWQSPLFMTQDKYGKFGIGVLCLACKRAYNKKRRLDPDYRAKENERSSARHRRIAAAQSEPILYACEFRDYIKLGVSNNFRNRARQSYLGATLLFTWTCRDLSESQLKDQWRHLLDKNVGKEWFVKTPQIMRWLTSLRRDREYRVARRGIEKQFEQTRHFAEVFNLRGFSDVSKRNTTSSEEAEG